MSLGPRREPCPRGDRHSLSTPSAQGLRKLQSFLGKFYQFYPNLSITLTPD
ncbi:hypothetical protein NG799_09265 [Laspinema sp. D1]|uniref:Uncharacterized protein n=1 Tax=Laspinema palackyanum D2a TaxID=2953684 RepID=A0ABT2MP38_9CYAN|nr:hypothetical protein [Laspinema sp. D2b]MCT7966519.1 hypothetical protein [Laspinema sp. D2a]